MNVIKPNCYICKHRRNVPGDAHSKCNHPAFKEANDNPMLQIMGIFASVGRTSPIQVKSSIHVKGSEHGIRKGWFNHPFNFDPTWLEECDGFEEITEVDK